MSPKRLLLLVAGAVVVGSAGGALTLDTSAAGSPATPLVPVAPAAAAPAAVAPAAQAAAMPEQPDTTLTLPTTLHLVNRNTATSYPGGTSHLVITSVLTKKGHAAGSGVYTCVKNGSGDYNCDSAFALAGGMLVTHESITGTTLSGKITGGTGKYAGASGTVKATQRSDGKQKLTLSYNLG